MEKRELQRKIIATVVTSAVLGILLAVSVVLLLSSNIFTPVIQWLMIASCGILAIAMIGFIWSKVLEIKTLKVCIREDITPPVSNSTPNFVAPLTDDKAVVTASPVNLHAMSQEDNNLNIQTFNSVEPAPVEVPAEPQAFEQSFEEQTFTQAYEPIEHIAFTPEPTVQAFEEAPLNYEVQTDVQAEPQAFEQSFEEQTFAQAYEPIEHIAFTPESTVQAFEEAPLNYEVQTDVQAEPQAFEQSFEEQTFAQAYEPIEHIAFTPESTVQAFEEVPLNYEVQTEVQTDVQAEPQAFEQSFEEQPYVQQEIQPDEIENDLQFMQAQDNNIIEPQITPDDLISNNFEQDQFNYSNEPVQEPIIEQLPDDFGNEMQNLAAVSSTNVIEPVLIAPIAPQAPQPIIEQEDTNAFEQTQVWTKDTLNTTKAKSINTQIQSTNVAPSTANQNAEVKNNVWSTGETTVNTQNIAPAPKAVGTQPTENAQQQIINQTPKPISTINEFAKNDADERNAQRAAMIKQAQEKARLLKEQTEKKDVILSKPQAQPIAANNASAVASDANDAPQPRKAAPTPINWGDAIKSANAREEAAKKQAALVEARAREDAIRRANEKERLAKEAALRIAAEKEKIAREAAAKEQMMRDIQRKKQEREQEQQRLAEQARMQEQERIRAEELKRLNEIEAQKQRELQQAMQKAEAERLDAQRKAEAERLEAERKAEAERAEAERKAEEERLAKEKAREAAAKENARIALEKAKHAEEAAKRSAQIAERLSALAGLAGIDENDLK